MRKTIMITLAAALAGCQAGAPIGEKQENLILPPIPPSLLVEMAIDNKHDALGFCGATVAGFTGSVEGGYVERYQNCDITDQPGPSGGPFEVHGAIRDAWHSFSSESGWFGYPLTDETNGLFGGRMSVFEHGFITWNSSSGIGLFPNTPPPSRAFDSGQINLDNGVPGNGNCQLGVAANGDWDFHGHAHDSGFPDYQYSIGASINWTDAQGNRHSKYITGDGRVEGSIHLFGAHSDDDVHLSGNDPDIAANWPAIAQNGWFQPSLHMSADGGGIFLDVLTDLTYGAIVSAGLVVGIIASGPSSPDGEYHCVSAYDYQTANEAHYVYDCGR